ncbi:MAG: phosphoribosyl-ATP diphosphatase [Devosiaceae bacterium]|nr:phosphoribosyl-ATP diphosphatase [Devosiaceae bacterium MH13]
MARFTLEDLDVILARRADAPSDESYTASLMKAGPAKAARKFGEEAVETMIAALEGDRDALTNEAADLLYHLLVVLRIGEVPLEDVFEELARRTGQSGLAEKASRTS